MNLTKYTIHAGLPEPVRLLHISDTHLAYADERDDERKRELAARRSDDFNKPYPGLMEREFFAAVNYAREHHETVIHTGDLMDFVSVLNLEVMKSRLAMTDIFFVPGNHEYSLYVEVADECEEYKMQSFAQVQAAAPNPLLFASRQIGGLNIVGIDNGYYYFTEAQRDFLKQEIARGLPILLAMHVPLYTPELYRCAREDHHLYCGYLVGVPEELLATYEDPYRIKQQKADAVTLEMVELIKHTPLIKAVLAGHMHFAWQGMLTPELPQFVCNGPWTGCAMEYTVL